jgi:outer membrane lipoprotein LolB
LSLGGRATALCVALCLAACARMPTMPLPAGPALSGRLAVHVDASATSAAHDVGTGFELLGDADSGQLSLTTPLGTMLAQARWAPGSVVLTTPQGRSSFADLDALTREVLGENVPVVALFDWLRGRPWPGAPTTGQATPAGFEQLGWAVSLEHYDDAWITARREGPPLVTVRAKLDRP